MIMLEVFLGIVAGLLLVPVTVLMVQVLAALPACRVNKLPEVVRPRLAVLIPAHNEASGIADAVRSIIAQLASGDRVIVVADNCSDETGTIAASAGAEVIERSDTERCGKGYALDFGTRYLENDPPEVLLIIDADCQVHEGTIGRLACHCTAVRRPVQALYLMHSPAGGGLQLRVAEFAWLVKNLVRPLGFLRLGLPCQLMGTGMAFPWELIREAKLANGNITEDMKLGVDLASTGFPPLFFPDAIVSSSFAMGAAGVKSQRTRWEHGHLSTILSEFPSLFAKAFLRRDVSLLGLALDLLVPPLALLLLLLSCAFIVTLVASRMNLSSLPLMLSSTALGLFTFALLLAWHGWARPVISLFDLINIPFYVLSKIPLYVKFWIRRQKQWVRTDRH